MSDEQTDNLKSVPDDEEASSDAGDVKDGGAGETETPDAPETAEKITRSDWLNLPEDSGRFVNRARVRGCAGAFYLLLTLLLVGLANTIVLSTASKLGLSDNTNLADGFTLALQLIPGAVLLGGSLIEVLGTFIQRINAKWFSSVYAPMFALVYVLAIYGVNAYLLPFVATHYYIPQLQAAIDRRDVHDAERYADLAIRFYSFDWDDIFFPLPAGQQKKFPSWNPDPQNRTMVFTLYDETDPTGNTLMAQWPILAQHNIARLYELEGADLDRAQEIYENMLTTEGCWLFGVWQFGELVNNTSRSNLDGGATVDLNRALNVLNNAIFLIDNPQYYDSQCSARYKLDHPHVNELRYWLHRTRGETLFLTQNDGAAWLDFDTAVRLLSSPVPLAQWATTYLPWVHDDVIQTAFWNRLITSAMHRPFIRRVQLAFRLGDQVLLKQACEELHTYVIATKENSKPSSWVHQDLIDYIDLANQCDPYPYYPLVSVEADTHEGL